MSRNMFFDGGCDCKDGTFTIEWTKPPEVVTCPTCKGTRLKLTPMGEHALDFLRELEVVKAEVR